MLHLKEHEIFKMAEQTNREIRYITKVINQGDGLFYSGVICSMWKYVRPMLVSKKIWLMSCLDGMLITHPKAYGKFRKYIKQDTLDCYEHGHWLGKYTKNVAQWNASFLLIAKRRGRDGAIKYLESIYDNEIPF